MAKTWRELKAEGKYRCCAMLTSTKTGRSFRCRRVATVSDGAFGDTIPGWCEKHGRTMRAVHEWNKSLMRQAEQEMARDERDDED